MSIHAINKKAVKNVPYHEHTASQPYVFLHNHACKRCLNSFLPVRPQKCPPMRISCRLKPDIFPQLLKIDKGLFR